MTLGAAEQLAKNPNSAEKGLPAGWVLARMGDLVDITSGKFIKRSEYSQTPDKPYPVAGAGGPIGWTDRSNFKAPIMTLGRVGAAGALNLYQSDAWVTDNALVVQTTNKGLFDLFSLFFRTVKWADLHTGSSQPLITQTLVKQLLLPFPPLAEQKRIVAKVEQLLARVNAARERLAKVPEILKRFRQSVLAAACSGRLTADWREKNPGVESAKALVERVLKEQKNAVMTKNRSFDLKTLREKLMYCEKDKEQFSHSIDIPAKWLSTSFYKLCILQRGFDLPTRKRIAGPFPIVSSSGVSGSHNEFKIKGPCVYVGRSGSVGKTFYLESDAWPLNTTLFVKEFNGNYPKFVYYYLSFMGLERFSSSTAVPTLNRNTFTFEQVQIPPLEEQKEIVNRVVSLFRISDQIEGRYEKAKTHVDKLTQSILAKAFRAELVPTEAELAQRECRSYEPASALLAKIEAQRKEVKLQRKHGRSRRWTRNK